MRTVSFSSKPVQQLLNDDFECTAINTVGDPTAGMSMGHAPDDRPGVCSRGIGKQNVQCLFLTPDSKIFHAVSGFVGPNDLKSEIEFAKTVYADLKRTASPVEQKQRVAKLHADRIVKLGFSPEDLTAPERSMPEQMMREMKNRFGLNRRGRASRTRVGPSLASMMQRARQRDFTGDNFHASKNPGVLSFKGRPAVLRDYKFMMEEPLMPMSEFLEEPQRLVGYERTAFATGEASGGSIGGP